MEFLIRQFNIENLAAAAGVLDSKILGSGTTQAPQVMRYTSSDLLQRQNSSMYCKYVLVDGTTHEVQAWSCDFDPAQEAQLRSGEGTPVRFNGSAKNLQFTLPALP
jgi:hypothetical protein